jgi:hypothetical protein
LVLRDAMCGKAADDGVAGLVLWVLLRVSPLLGRNALR